MTFTQKSRQLLKSLQLLKRLFLGRLFGWFFRHLKHNSCFFVAFSLIVYFFGVKSIPSHHKTHQTTFPKAQGTLPHRLATGWYSSRLQSQRDSSKNSRRFVLSVCLRGGNQITSPGGGIVKGWVQAGLIVNLLGKSSTSFFNIRFFMRDLVSFKYECLNLWMNLHHLNKLWCWVLLYDEIASELKEFLIFVEDRDQICTSGLYLQIFHIQGVFFQKKHFGASPASDGWLDLNLLNWKISVRRCIYLMKYRLVN